MGNLNRNMQNKWIIPCLLSCHIALKFHEDLLIKKQERKLKLEYDDGIFSIFHCIQSILYFLEGSQEKDDEIFSKLLSSSQNCMVTRVSMDKDFSNQASVILKDLQNEMNGEFIPRFVESC